MNGSSVGLAPGPVEHWAYQVDSPFRSVGEVVELAETGVPDANSFTVESFDVTEELADIGHEDLDEVAQGGFGATQAFADLDEDEDEALVEDESLDQESPLTSIGALPGRVTDALGQGAWAVAVALAIASGNRDVNKLTNMVFWARHPSLAGTKLRPEQRDLIREWLDIRDRIVAPAVKRASLLQPTPITPAPLRSAKYRNWIRPARVLVGQKRRVAFDPSKLRWYGSQPAPAGIMDFMRRVYGKCVDLAQGDFVDVLPDGATAHLEDGHELRKDAVPEARAMLEAARKELQVVHPDVEVGIVSAYRPAAQQWSLWQGETGKGFLKYYNLTKDEREATGEPHGDKAANILAVQLAKMIAAPGYSNHQDGLALDLGTRARGARSYGAIRRDSWFYAWLWKNAEQFHFCPYPKEAWHWVYRPSGCPAENWKFPPVQKKPKANKESGEWEFDEAPSGIAAGEHEIRSTALLKSHRGVPPDVILRWNAMPANVSEVDVVVHFHGYSWPKAQLRKHLQVWAGLDLAPVDGASGIGRSRPTLTILPRGDDTGIALERNPKLNKYFFPALKTSTAVDQLIQLSLGAFAREAGIAIPRIGRRILTAHSGGGAALLKVVKDQDPDEVHLYDALYQPADALQAWAVGRLRKDVASGAGAPDSGGALRVFYRPGTAKFSRPVGVAIARALQGAPASLAARYRVERSTLNHFQIPRQYGWRMLADASATVPDTVHVRTPAPKPVTHEVDELELEDEDEFADEGGFTAGGAGIAESLGEDEAGPGLGLEDEAVEAAELEGLGLAGRNAGWSEEFEDPELGLELDSELDESEGGLNVAEDTEFAALEAIQQLTLPIDSGLMLQEVLQEAEQSLTDRIKSALASGIWPVAVGMLVTAGVRDENRLTNVIFHTNHPELLGRSIRPDEKALIEEWIRIRDGTVRPLLQRLSAGTAGGGVALAGSGGTEYVPAVGAPDFGRRGSRPEELGRMDLDAIYQNNQTLRERVVAAADALGLDPGALAASLHAEKSSADVWTRTSGTARSEDLGLDDWFDTTMAGYLRRVIRDHPTIGIAYDDVTQTGEFWNTGTEKAGGGLKPRGSLDATKSVAAVAVYIAGAEAMLKRILVNHAKKTGMPLPAMEALQPEQRLTILRLAFNGGVIPARNLFLKIAAGGDIPRTGKTTRDPDNAPRTAVLHMARGVHLSQAIFGRPASDYRPSA